MKQHNITIRFKNQAVHLESDDHLKEYIRSSPGALASVEEMIREGFREEYRRNIKIKGRSLRTEILMHAYADTVFLKLIRMNEKLPGMISSVLERPLKKLQGSSAVIDIGERYQDNNRFVFDWLSLGEPVITTVFRKLV